MKSRKRSLMIVLFLAAILFFSFSQHVQAAICTWDGSTGNWNDPNKWSCGYVPGVGDEAVLNNGTVNMTADAVVGELTLSGGTLTGPFNLSANTIVWSEGVMSGSGATTATSAANFTGTNQMNLFDRTFNNAGTLNWDKTGNLYMNPADTTFNNQLGAIFSVVNSGSTIVYGPGTFNNYGTLNLTTGKIETATFRQEARGIINLAVRGTTPVSDYCQIGVGDIYLDGALNITFTGGYTPVVGDHFILLWGNNRTGDFSQVSIPYLDGIDWNLFYEGNTLNLWAIKGLLHIFVPFLLK